MGDGMTTSNRGGGGNGGGNKPEWLQQYDLIGKIGEGTYGLVFLARIKSPSNRGKSIAIKKFKQSKDGDGVSPTAIREIMVSTPLLLLLIFFLSLFCFDELFSVIFTADFDRVLFSSVLSNGISCWVLGVGVLHLVGLKI